MAGKSPSPPPAIGGIGAEAEPIGVDPKFTREDPDNDSTIDSDEENLGSTASINSSILEYRKLHGRTYHNYAGAEYWGPNDERQNEALDLAHHMMYLAFDNRLFLAPLDNPQKVLDVGTGTGIWAIDFADEFPEAEVTGTDLSPIQPSWVLPNCSFEIDNAELEWTFADNTFDYIHIRGLIGSIEDWPKLYSECLRCLKPGGWFEQQEFALPIASNEDPFPDDCIWHLWEKIFREAGRKTGRTFELTDHWVKWMEEAGFRDDIHTDSVRLPLGNWPLDKKFKDVGIINRTSFEQGLEGYASYLCTQVLGWRQEEVTVLLAKVRQVIKNKSYHAYYPLKTAYTQKPKV